MRTVAEFRSAFSKVLVIEKKSMFIFCMENLKANKKPNILYPFNTYKMSYKLYFFPFNFLIKLPSLEMFFENVNTCKISTFTRFQYLYFFQFDFLIKLPTVKIFFDSTYFQVIFMVGVKTPMVRPLLNTLYLYVLCLNWSLYQLVKQLLIFQPYHMAVLFWLI